MNKVYKPVIALYGLGTVGTGFAELLFGSKNFTLKYVVVKSSKKSRPFDIVPYTGDPLDPVNDPEVDTIVELTNDAAFSKILIEAALKKGKKVITANKKMLASHIHKLENIAFRNGGLLLYEAAAAASIPVFLLAEQYFFHDRVLGIRAVLNGTSNFILSAMEESGFGFSEALKKAQDAGFAETDPSLDIEGRDAAFKLTLLCRKLMRRKMSPAQLNIQGISEVRKTHASLAAQLGWRIRHLCEIREEGGTLRSFVGPAFVRSDDPLFHLQEANNGIQIQTSGTGEQYLSGKGAGKYPTGFAVWADLNRSSPTAQNRPEVSDFPVMEMSAIYCRISEEHTSFSAQNQVILEGEWNHLWVQVCRFNTHPGSGWIRLESHLLAELSTILWHKQVYA